MSSRKKRSHYCSNHPEIKTRMQCTKCGKWICSECALTYQSNHYCIKTCIPSEILTVSQMLSTVGKEEKKSDKKFWPVITWAALTFALCSIVFGVWTLKQIYHIENENRILQKNRNILISNLQKNNREIKKLVNIVKNDNPDTILKLQKNKPKNSKPAVSKPDKPDNNPKIPYTFNNGTAGKRLVSLTFDGGYMANAATDILDTLLSRNVKASMFVTGHFIRRYPEIIERIVLDGHDLGNHTMTHPHLTTYAQTRTQTTLQQITSELLKTELRSAEKLLYEKTGHKFSPLWRAPYGEYNNSICSWAQDHGYVHVGWRQGRTWTQGLDCNDWVPDKNTPGFKTPSEVMDKILNLAETKPYGINGGIILLHLGTARKNKQDQVHRILGTLIDSIRTHNYTFVPVSEMLKESGVDLALLSPGINLSESEPNKKSAIEHKNDES